MNGWCWLGTRAIGYTKSSHGSRIFQWIDFVSCSWPGGSMYVGAILDSNQPAYWPRKPNQLIIWFIPQVNTEKFCHIQILAKMKLSGITPNHPLVFLVIHDGRRHEQTTQLKRTKTCISHSYETHITNIIYIYLSYDIYMCTSQKKWIFRNKTHPTETTHPCQQVTKTLVLWPSFAVLVPSWLLLPP